MENLEQRSPDDDGGAHRIGEIEEPLPFLAVEKALYDVGIFFYLDHQVRMKRGLSEWLFFLFVCAFGKSYLRTDAAETDIGALFVLIFPLPQIGTQIVGDIFPATSADNLAFHLVGILLGRVVAIFGIYI